MITPKRYWWLQLPEQFFEQKEMVILKSCERGAEIALCYLKMMLLSLRSEGELEITGMYYSDVDEIAAMLHETDVDVVRYTINYFTEFGKIEKMANGSFYMNEVVELTGSESEAAERQRKHRDKKKEIQEKADADKGKMKLLSENADIDYPEQSETEESVTLSQQCHTYKEKDKNKYQYINKEINKTETEINTDTLSQTENTVSDMENTLSDEGNTVSPPTIDEVREYCIQNGLKTNPDILYSFFDGGTWYENGKLRDWKGLADSNFYIA